MDNYKLLIHSWGTKPEQKRREAEYNREYYQKHKEKWLNNQKTAEQNVDRLSKLTGKVDNNSYSAKTNVHLKKMPKEKVDETSYINNYIDDNTRDIYEKLLTDWHKKNDVKYEDRNKDTIAEYNKKFKLAKFELGNQAREIASQRAKKSYDELYGDRANERLGRQRRTQEINDGKAANEAAKAETARVARNEKIQKYNEDYERYTKEAKHAKRLATYYTMKEYEAELADEKNAPMRKKIRKFIDGTVEVAMDTAKKNISKGQEWVTNLFKRK